MTYNHMNQTKYTKILLINIWSYDQMTPQMDQLYYHSFALQKILFIDLSIDLFYDQYTINQMITKYNKIHFNCFALQIKHFFFYYFILL